MSEVIEGNIQLWRQKARDNTLSTAEMRAAIAAIRTERVGKGEVSAASKEKKATVAKKKAPVDSDALLGELGI